MVKEFINLYGYDMLHTFVLAFFGFIGIAIKNVFKKYLDDKTKKEVAMTVVEAMEQMYSDLTGTERYEKAMESMSEMLAQKGIAVTELEIKMLIEAAVKEMNTNIKKTEAATASIVAPKSKSKSKTEAK